MSAGHVTLAEKINNSTFDAHCARKGAPLNNPQPNMVILESDFSYTIPRMRFISEAGTVRNYAVTFEQLPSEDGQLIFGVKSLMPLGQ